MRFPVSWLLAACCATAVLAGCGSTSGPDVLTAPIQVVRTADGTVGYRELGSGPPLLLITGASASMDDWPPSFIDGLAAHHTVVVFDNAGVGRTAAVSAPGSLNITAMASQTSALISALRLRRPAVLGWSMGGMIAQALAVGHPAQVSRLILAATAPGTGKAVPLPPSAAQQCVCVGLSPARLVAHLFPDRSSRSSVLPQRCPAVCRLLRNIRRDLSRPAPSSSAMGGRTKRSWSAGGRHPGAHAGRRRNPGSVHGGGQRPAPGRQRARREAASL
jgi:pimeloyl-ACP methyl ester carboxylesterase